jgi:hypothetical protein
MDRHEWTSVGGTPCWIEPGIDGNGNPEARAYSVGGWTHLLADEILRLAARLKEAEELLREQGGDGDCNVCGHFMWAHQEGCRLHRFLSEQSSAPPG